MQEPDEDIHAGETCHCNECGAAVVLVALNVALNMETLASPATIRWGCHFRQPGPCRLAPPSGGPENTDSSNKED